MIPVTTTTNCYRTVNEDKNDQSDYHNDTVVQWSPPPLAAAEFNSEFTIYLKIHGCLLTVAIVKQNINFLREWLQKNIICLLNCAKMHVFCVSIT
jgi:hypothetical protein